MPRKPVLDFTSVVAAAILSIVFVSGVRADDRIAYEVIVELQPGIDIEEINETYLTHVIAAVETRHLYLLGLPEEWDEETIADLLDEDPRIVALEAHNKKDVGEGQTESFYLYVSPDDFEQQPTWPRIGVPFAHITTLGEGVVVAIIDTGLDATHEAITAPIHAASIDLLDGDEPLDDGDGLDQDGDGEVDELRGHGTFMAGLIQSVAPDAELLIVRAIEADGAVHAFDAVRGIYHAIDNGADIINLSLAMDSDQRFMRDAIREARDAGVLVMAAAGNDDLEPPSEPARFDDTWGIASADANDRKSAFSNYGGSITLSAPGSDLVSLLPGDLYAIGSGTSSATAVTSGAAALALAGDPTAAPEDAANRLLDVAQDIGDLNPDYAGQLGAGRLDLANLFIIVTLSGDLDGDGCVGFSDLLIVLGAWGETDSPADINLDGIVDFGDLLVLFAYWSC